MPSLETAPPSRPHRAWRHPLVLGTAAAAAALAAAVSTALLLAPADDAAVPAVPEVQLELTDENREPGSGLGGDSTGAALPEGRLDRLDGGFGSFAEYRGEPLVVNFFASWCAPCVAEMPAFESVHQALGDQVAFVGLNLRDEMAAAAALVERTGVTYDVLLDPRGDVATALDVVVMPSTLFVSPDGRVLDTAAGELSADELRRRIDSLFGT